MHIMYFITTVRMKKIIVFMDLVCIGIGGTCKHRCQINNNISIRMETNVYEK